MGCFFDVKFFFDVRVDIWVGKGIEMLFFYDFLIVKVIVKGLICEDVFGNMIIVLKEIKIYGIEINLEYFF